MSSWRLQLGRGPKSRLGPFIVLPPPLQLQDRSSFHAMPLPRDDFRTVRVFSMSCTPEHWWSASFPQIRHTSGQMSSLHGFGPKHHNMNGCAVWTYAPLTRQAHSPFALDPRDGPSLRAHHLAQRTLLLLHWTSRDVRVELPTRQTAQVSLVCCRSLKLPLKEDRRFLHCADPRSNEKDTCSVCMDVPCCGCHGSELCCTRNTLTNVLTQRGSTFRLQPSLQWPFSMHSSRFSHHTWSLHAVV